MNFNLENEIVRRENKSVYRDGDKLIKLFVASHPKADIFNEALNHARVEENTDLNIPKLLEVTKVDDRWALVSEFVEGKTLGEIMAENPQKEDEYLQKFVKLQLEVLSKKVPLLTRIKEKFNRKLSQVGELDEEVKFELLHRLEGMKNHTKLCHGDFNPNNIIISKNGKMFIIDWSHATQGNASADAANTFLIFSMEGKAELAEKYLNEFSKLSGIEKSNIQRWIPIVAAARIEKCSPKEKEMLISWASVVDYQ